MFKEQNVVGNTKQVVSLTQNFQLLADFAVELSASDLKKDVIAKPLQALTEMAKMGITLETESSAITMKANAGKIEEMTVGLGPQKSIPYIGKPGKTLEYHLPLVTDTASLILTCCYLSYLLNYSKVVYQGCVSFFRSMVQDNIDKNKPRFHAKTCFLKQEIQRYCQANNIDYVGLEALFNNATDAKLVNDLQQYIHSCMQQANHAELESLENVSVQEAKDAYLHAKQRYDICIELMKQLKQLERKIKDAEHHCPNSLGSTVSTFFLPESNSWRSAVTTKSHQALIAKFNELCLGIEPIISDACLDSLLEKKNLARDVWEQVMSREARHTVSF